MNNHICALVIGNTLQSPGSKNEASGITEFGYNEALSTAVMEKCNVLCVRIYQDKHEHLIEIINALNPDFVVSMHCNSFDKRISGTETLYLERDILSRELSTILQHEFVKALGLSDQGIKPIKTNLNSRLILGDIAPPTVIAGPFFIDNDKDMAKATLKRTQLVSAYANGIEEFSKRLSEKRPESE